MQVSGKSDLGEQIFLVGTPVCQTQMPQHLINRINQIKPTIPVNLINPIHQISSIVNSFDNLEVFKVINFNKFVSFVEVEVSNFLFSIF